jgi:C4-dicarboxylate transporter, DctM subunit
MSPLIVGFIGFIIMLVLKGLRSPIGVGLALIGCLGVWFLKDADTTLFVLGTAPVESLSQFTLAVFPLFILMGIIVLKAGLADGLYNAASAMIGHWGGGLKPHLVQIKLINENANNLHWIIFCNIIIKLFRKQSGL